MESTLAAHSEATSLRRASTSTRPSASAGVIGKAESPFRSIGTSFSASRGETWPPNLFRRRARPFRHEYLVLAQKLAGKRAGDEGAGLGDAVENDEGAEARAALLAEQDLVDRREPGLGDAGAPVGALRLAGGVGEMPAPDLVDDGLQGLGIGRAFVGGKRLGELRQRRALGLVRQPVALRR